MCTPVSGLGNQFTSTQTALHFGLVVSTTNILFANFQTGLRHFFIIVQQQVGVTCNNRFSLFDYSHLYAWSPVNIARINLSCGVSSVAPSCTHKPAITPVQKKWNGMSSMPVKSIPHHIAQPSTWIRWSASMLRYVMVYALVSGIFDILPICYFCSS